jgi:predicted transcriptional regulator
MRGKTIGDQELALLQYVAEQGGATVGEVAAGFGEERGLARSTVLTMMERLRGQDSVVQSAVASFVEKTLQGSVSPFVAFMSHKAEVSDQELAELEALVAQLQSRKREG